MPQNSNGLLEYIPGSRELLTQKNGCKQCSLRFTSINTELEAH